MSVSLFESKTEVTPKDVLRLLRAVEYIAHVWEQEGRTSEAYALRYALTDPEA